MMGIWERLPDWFLDALGKQFGFDPPGHHGLDSVEGVRAMWHGRANVFVRVAGNFVRAMSDSDVTRRRCAAAG